MGDKYSKASVVYDDAIGTAAVDWHPTQSDIHYWFERLGGNQESHWPIAMAIDRSEFGCVTVSVHAVERESRASDFDTIRDYLMKAREDGAVTVSAVHGEVSLEEIFEKMKRCQILLFQRGFAELGLTLNSTRSR